MNRLFILSLVICNMAFGQRNKSVDYDIQVINSGTIESDSMKINGISFVKINVNITSPSRMDFNFKFTGNGKTNYLINNNSSTIYIPRFVDCDTLLISSNEYPKIRLAMANYPYNTIEIKITESTEATKQKKTRRRRDKKFVVLDF